MIDVMVMFSPPLHSMSSINDLISKLTIPANIVDQAVKLQEEFPEENRRSSKEGDQLTWFAGFLYIASVEQR